MAQRKDNPVTFVMFTFQYAALRHKESSIKSFKNSSGGRSGYPGRTPPPKAKHRIKYTYLLFPKPRKALCTPLGGGPQSDRFSVRPRGGGGGVAAGGTDQKTGSGSEPNVPSAPTPAPSKMCRLRRLRSRRVIPKTWLRAPPFFYYQPEGDDTV